MIKIVHYRNKCVGCGICYEQQPELWRMSKKDGKASLLKSTAKKKVFMLSVSNAILHQVWKTARECPVKIIKIV